MSVPSVLRSSVRSTTSLDSGYAPMKADGAAQEAEDSGLILALEEIVISTGRENGGADTLEAVKKAMESWPRPSKDFVLEQAKKAKIQLYCRICDGKGQPSDFVLCSGCGSPHRPAHRSCLASYPRHNLGGGDEDEDDDDDEILYGEPCREYDLEEYIYMAYLLDSRMQEKDKRALHADDLWSTWLAVPQEQSERYPQLWIWPRLQQLLTAAPERPPRQYPSLVSFVGDTGAGKSTVIRAMIRLLAPQAHKDYRVPIPGSSSDGFDSTSSDVHLFADPATASTQVPLMFVDCEGFSGTDTPIARQVLSNSYVPKYETSRAMQEGTLRGSVAGKQSPISTMVNDHAGTVQNRVDLKWGKLVVPIEAAGTGIPRKTQGQVDAGTRKIVIKSLYPRLLYSFSDVVCFVTTNSRAAQTILEEMFLWAKDGHDKTLNQRVRPGLIIVLNKMTHDSHNNLADSSFATNRLLKSFQKSRRFGELQAKWARRGRDIKTAEDLINCYYDSFRVISIPQHTREPAIAKQVSGQIKALYGYIGEMSQQIRAKKLSVNMDLDVPSLQAYLHQSIKALGADYQNSLDFHQLSEGDSPLPRRFSEHLVQLMSSMVKLRNLDSIETIGGEAELVMQMVPYIAACIVAQIRRSSKQEEIQKQKDGLVEEARRGLEQFRNKHWRCEAKSSTGRWRCKNYFNGHEKGHQFRLPSSGPLNTQNRLAGSEEDLGIGQYTSSFDPDDFADRLWEEVANLHDRSYSFERLALMATASGVKNVTGQRTCLTCLSNTPTNMLPCRPRQHGICEDCIRRYNGAKKEESVLQMTSCPLGCSLTTTPWSIRLKPKTAGARILSLDGGGIRGIVELVILAEIEKAVGYGIRIQELFDLVIGTSTGGIIALGVFEKGWSLSEAERQFVTLAEEAFSLRKALVVPVLSKVAEPFCDFKYKSAGINNALQKSLGHEPLFGQLDSSLKTGDRVKVGVITCQEGRLQPCLVANYSRNPLERLRDGRQADDCLQREDVQEKDFTIWQAARATSAAQTLFKAYLHEPTNRTYVDGATVRNNPVGIVFEEEKRIWHSGKQPDIVVSVGTGILVDKEGNVQTKKSDHLETLKGMLPKGIRKKVETGLDMVQATLDCHREWDNFTRGQRGSLRQHCHRLDVSLTNKPPRLDDVNELYPLLNKARAYATSKPDSPGVPPYPGHHGCARDHILAVARRLRASLFYLAHDLGAVADEAAKQQQGGGGGGGVQQQGRALMLSSAIHCRLPPNSEGANSLLANKPQFRLREIGANSDEVIRHLVLGGFDQKTLASPVRLEISQGRYARIIEVQFPRREGYWEPIGGF